MSPPPTSAGWCNCKAKVWCAQCEEHKAECFGHYWGSPCFAYCKSCCAKMCASYFK